MSWRVDRTDSADPNPDGDVIKVRMRAGPAET